MGRRYSQLIEHLDGFFREITSYPDDPVRRQSIVKRSMAGFDESSNSGVSGAYPPYMTAEQIADYLQVGVKKIRKWTSEGRIPHSELGSIVRFKKDEIDSAIKERSLKTKNPESGKRKAVS